MSLPLKPALFLDRDGIILEPVLVDGQPKSIRYEEDIAFVDGLHELLSWAEQSELDIFVVTNQPDVDRGLITSEDVSRLHERIVLEHPVIRKIYFCPHDDVTNCNCRKPKPGMLTLAAGNHSLDLRESILIGDRWRDIDAGNSVGCFTIFFDRGYDEQLNTKPDAVVGSLSMATTIIRQHLSRKTENG